METQRTKKVKLDSELELMDKVLGNGLILKQIFTHLPLRVLLWKCAQVNHLWKSTAELVISQRTNINHLFKLYKINNDPHGRRREKGIIETQLEGDGLLFIKNNFDEFKLSLQEDLGSLYSHTRFALLFDGGFCPRFKKSDQLLKYNYCRKYFPEDCELISISSSAGIIGTSFEQTNNNSKLKSIETQSHISSVAGISFTLFPQLPGVEFYMFDSKDPLNNLQSRNDLKCVLVFSTSCCQNSTGDYIRYSHLERLLMKYDEKIALGGVIVDDVSFYPLPNTKTSFKRNRDVLGIAISGPRVQACSLILKTEKPKDTEAKLVQFKSNLPFDDSDPTTQTIAFIFICTGRGFAVYNQPNVEANLFNKIFPQVKLFGVFGQGEFGHDYWPSYDVESRKAKRKLKKIRNRNSEKLESLSSSSSSSSLTESAESQADSINKETDYKLWHFYSTVIVMINFPRK